MENPPCHVPAHDWEPVESLPEAWGWAAGPVTAGQRPDLKALTEGPRNEAEVADATREIPGTAAGIEARAAALHENHLVIDALNTPYPPQVPDFPSCLDLARRGGVTAIHATMHERRPGGWGWDATLRALSAWHGALHRHEGDARLVTRTRHIGMAKAENRLGVICGLQNAACLEDDLGRLEILHGFGVRIVQPTYNGRNQLGDGCLAEGDGGLSEFGAGAVARCDDLGLLVDVSHCSPRTSLDAVAVSRNPVAATHVGAAALYPHPRNKTDEALAAIAAKGGVIGIVGVPLFLRREGPDSIGDMLDHLDHVVGLVGVDHVGIGHDNFVHPGAEHFRTNERIGLATGREALVGKMPEAALMSEARWAEYSRARLAGFEDIAGWPNLTRGLVERRYGDGEIAAILGGNWMRLFARVWEGTVQSGSPAA